MPLEALIKIAGLARLHLHWNHRVGCELSESLQNLIWPEIDGIYELLIENSKRRASTSRTFLYTLKKITCSSIIRCCLYDYQ